MKENEGTMLGHIVLNQIPGAECIMHPKKNLRCVIIPLEDNPGITTWEPDNDESKMLVKLWFKIIRKKEVDRNGHTHFAKVHVSKRAVEEYGLSPEQEKLASKIIGNLKTFANETPSHNSRGIGSSICESYDDLPPDDLPELNSRF